MTLRARVVIGTLVVALVMAVSVVAITSIIRDRLVHQVDLQLYSAANGGLRVSRGPAGDPGHPPADDDHFPSAMYIGTLNSGGLTALQEAKLGNPDRPAPDPAPQTVLDGLDSGRPFTVGSSGSSEYRMLVGQDHPGGQVLAIALPLDSVNETMDRLVLYEVIATAMVVLVLGLVTFWVIHLGVRPIKRMTVTASAIAAGDLSHRVPPSAEGTEAHDLGEALNGMLNRLETAFDERTRSENRLRQFVGDASHELRTPITTIRGYAELYRAGALGTDEQMAEAMRRTEQEAVRMGSLVDDLLHLARLDQGRPLQDDPVDLAAVARDAAMDASAVAPDRDVSVQAEGMLVVRGDEDRLRQVVANLIGNALVHTPPGSPIEVAVSVVPAGAEEAPWVALWVTDHGPGMAPEVAERAFERFYRADSSRSRHRGGSGLGLAIVQATVEALGGRVEMATAPGQGTTVKLLLPLAGESEPATPGGPPTTV